MARCICLAFRARFPDRELPVGDSLFSAAAAADTRRRQFPATGSIPEYPLAVTPRTPAPACVTIWATSHRKSYPWNQLGAYCLKQGTFASNAHLRRWIWLRVLRKRARRTGWSWWRDEQTAGRGRHGRKWVSAPGRDLLASILFRPRPAMLQEIQFVASLAAVKAIQKTTGRSPQIKWPNDICVDGKKVCGVLVESYEDPRGLVAIVGFGLNLYTSTAIYPDLPPATSLSELSELAGRNIDRDHVLKLLVQSADDLYRRVARGDSLLDEWSTLVNTVGQRVNVAVGDPQRPERVITGIAEGIGEYGRLLVRDDEGRLWPLMAGDVSLSACGSNGEGR